MGFNQSAFPLIPVSEYLEHRLFCLPVYLIIHYDVFRTFRSRRHTPKKGSVREMKVRKMNAHVWVRQNAPVKIYSSISVNVWERKIQLICSLLYYPLFSCLLLSFVRINEACFALEFD